MKKIFFATVMTYAFAALAGSGVFKATGTHYRAGETPFGSMKMAPAEGSKSKDIIEISDDFLSIQDAKSKNASDSKSFYPFHGCLTSTFALDNGGTYSVERCADQSASRSRFLTGTAVYDNGKSYIYEVEISDSVIHTKELNLERTDVIHGIYNLRR